MKGEWMKETEAKLMEALDALAWAWLEYRDDGEAKTTAAAMVESVLDIATAPEPAHPNGAPAAEDIWIPAADAARELGLAPPTFTHWTAEGIVPSQKMGREVLISRETVDRIAGLIAATPRSYKSPANYVAPILRREKWGDRRRRNPYPG